MVRKYPPRPSALRAPYRGDTGSFSIAVDVGGAAQMSSVTDVVLGLQAFTDVGSLWGGSLAKSAAMWDLTEEIERRGPGGLLDAVRDFPEMGALFDPLGVRGRIRRHPVEMWTADSPEFIYLRDVRAQLLAGDPIRVRGLRYENPLELILVGSGLMLTGAIMAARLVRDWSANRGIGRAEARKADAEARVSETWAVREEAVTDFVTTWLAGEAKRTSTPLPISEMAAISSMHNFAELRRMIERPVTLELPRGLDPTASDEG